jgi:hypothetical protein
MVECSAGKRRERFMRFTIRDLFWLTVVVALGLGWAREFYRSPSRQLEFRAKALKSAIEGEGYTVEQPTPFTVKVQKPGVQIEISGEKSIADGNPFGPDPYSGKDPFGSTPLGNDAGGDPFAAK